MGSNDKEIGFYGGFPYYFLSKIESVLHNARGWENESHMLLGRLFLLRLCKAWFFISVKDQKPRPTPRRSPAYCKHLELGTMMQSESGVAAKDGDS
mmetsp:Transcript_18990/g.52019  ORF Transcript_18990/g.52019 Transcript_18990/m.52019 type:complete len:96 (-) Transcript_18990:1510-1797(-)